MNNTSLINIGSSYSPTKYIKAHFSSSYKARYHLEDIESLNLTLHLVYKKIGCIILNLYHNMFILGKPTDMGTRCLKEKNSNIILSTEKKMVLSPTLKLL